jgi:DNA-binding CsgD family transcriptional regulator
MSHISIFLYIISLITGTTAIIDCSRILKNQQVFLLKSFLNFIILFNLNLLVNFTALYFSVNLSSQIKPDDLIPLWIAIGWFSFLTISGSVWFYFKFILNVLSIKRILHFELLFKTLAMGFIVIFSIGVADYIIRKNPVIYTYAIPLSEYAFSGLGILYSVLVILKADNNPVLKKRELLRSLGWFFSVVFSMIFAVSIFHSKNSVLLLAVISLSVNLSVLTRIKLFIIGFTDEQPDSTINRVYSVDQITEQYRLTIREKQVMDLIIRGKSNKEIEQELIISANTVKNHIYSIFRKTGVVSRGQLINRILSSKGLNLS